MSAADEFYEELAALARGGATREEVRQWFEEREVKPQLEKGASSAAPERIQQMHGGEQFWHELADYVKEGPGRAELTAWLKARAWRCKEDRSAEGEGMQFVREGWGHSATLTVLPGVLAPPVSEAPEETSRPPAQDEPYALQD